MKFYHHMLLGVFVAGALVGNTCLGAEELDDATILAIFDEANTMDIWTARLGAQYGASEEVRKLGRMVAADHEAVQQMGRDVARSLGMVPTPPNGDTAAKAHAETVAMLTGKTGTDFDKAYLAHEIAFHQGVIKAVRKTLLPATLAPELKALINKVLPGFEHHLAATKDVANLLGVKY